MRIIGSSARGMMDPQNKPLMACTLTSQAKAQQALKATLSLLTVEGHAQAVGSCCGGATQLLPGGIPGEGEACLGGLRGGGTGGHVQEA